MTDTTQWTVDALCKALTDSAKSDNDLALSQNLSLNKYDKALWDSALSRAKDLGLVAPGSDAPKDATKVKTGKKAKTGKGKADAPKGKGKADAPKGLDVTQAIVAWAMGNFPLTPCQVKGKVTWVGRLQSGLDKPVFTVTDGLHRGHKLFAKSALDRVLDGKDKAVSGLWVNPHTGLRAVKPHVDRGTVLAVRKALVDLLGHSRVAKDGKPVLKHAVEDGMTDTDVNK